MRIAVEYQSLLRDAAGCDAEHYEHKAPTLTLAELIAALAESHGKPFRDASLDDTGRPHSWLMITINDAMVRDPDAPLADGDRVTLGVPISGG